MTRVRTDQRTVMRPPRKRRADWGGLSGLHAIKTCCSVPRICRVCRLIDFSRWSGFRRESQHADRPRNRDDEWDEEPAVNFTPAIGFGQRRDRNDNRSQIKHQWPAGTRGEVWFLFPDPLDNNLCPSQRATPSNARPQIPHRLKPTPVAKTPLFKGLLNRLMPAGDVANLRGLIK